MSGKLEGPWSRKVGRWHPPLACLEVQVQGSNRILCFLRRSLLDGRVTIISAGLNLVQSENSVNRTAGRGMQMS